jgi:hypothetical protein
VPSRAQATDDEQTRTTFLVTRDQPAPAGRRQGRRASASKGAKASPLGVAYSVFTRQVDGAAVRVDPRGPFRAGDALRLVVEPNADGYLYVFNESEAGPAEMIFPDPRIDGGRNRVVAHSLVEIPSSREANDKYRWFFFYDGQTTERLFLVFSRVPLPGVPTGTALIRYCDAYRESCPWQPPQAVWQSVLDASRLPRRSSVGGVFGLAQTRGEQAAATRSIGLARDEPEPSSIHIGTSRDAKAIVVAFELATE